MRAAGRRDSAAGGGAYQPAHEYVSETPGSNRRSVSSPCRQIRRLDRQRARRTSGVRRRLLSNLRIFARKPPDIREVIFVLTSSNVRYNR